MKQYFIIFFITLFGSTYGQRPAENFFLNRCDFKTDGSGKTIGLKLKLSVPCDWKQKEGQRPHVINTFSSALPDSSSVVMLLLIQKLQPHEGKEFIKKAISEKGLRESLESSQKLVSAKTTTIDGIPCGELIFSQLLERASLQVSQYSIAYHIYYKSNLILLTYTVASMREGKLKEYIPDFTLLFRSLALDTVIINQWE